MYVFVFLYTRIFIIQDIGKYVFYVMVLPFMSWHLFLHLYIPHKKCQWRGKCFIWWRRHDFAMVNIVSVMSPRHWLGWLKVIEAEWRIYASVILTTIGSDNGLSPGRRQAIIWTNAGILLIGPFRTNISEILIEIPTLPFKKMCLKVSSEKWRPCCLHLNVSTLLLQLWLIWRSDTRRFHLREPDHQKELMIWLHILILCAYR